MATAAAQCAGAATHTAPTFTGTAAPVTGTTQSEGAASYGARVRSGAGVPATGPAAASGLGSFTDPAAVVCTGSGALASATARCWSLRRLQPRGVSLRPKLSLTGVRTRS